MIECDALPVTKVYSIMYKYSKVHTMYSRKDIIIQYSLPSLIRPPLIRHP